ncbi:hypothetical protein B0H11DRAFT_2248403 [Mycena galericulata]|nr:hypothetical protein B0H11DRAFT_2248403 [Mycena galericulata]
MSPWCDDDLQDFSRAEGAWQRICALSSRVQSVAHTGTRTPRPIPVTVLSAVAHAAPASSAAAALRDSDLHQSHIPRGPRGPRPGFASAARGRLRIRLYQRKGEDISMHSVGLVVPDDRTNEGARALWMHVVASSTQIGSPTLLAEACRRY